MKTRNWLVAAVLAAFVFLMGGCGGHSGGGGGSDATPPTDNTGTTAARNRIEVTKDATTGKPAELAITPAVKDGKFVGLACSDGSSTLDPTGASVVKLEHNRFGEHHVTGNNPPEALLDVANPTVKFTDLAVRGEDHILPSIVMIKDGTVKECSFNDKLTDVVGLTKDSEYVWRNGMLRYGSSGDDLTDDPEIAVIAPPAGNPLVGKHRFDVSGVNAIFAPVVTRVGNDDIIFNLGCERGGGELEIEVEDLNIQKITAAGIEDSAGVRTNASSLVPPFITPKGGAVTLAPFVVDDQGRTCRPLMTPQFLEVTGGTFAQGADGKMRVRFGDDSSTPTTPTNPNTPTTPTVRPKHRVDASQPGVVTFTPAVVGGNIVNLSCIGANGQVELEDKSISNLSRSGFESDGGGWVKDGGGRNATSGVSLPIVITKVSELDEGIPFLVFGDKKCNPITDPAAMDLVGATLSDRRLVRFGTATTPVIPPVTPVVVTKHRVDVSAVGAIHVALDMTAAAITHRLGKSGPLPDLPVTNLARAFLGSDLAGWPEIGGGNLATTQVPPILVFHKAGVHDKVAVFFVDTAGNLSWIDPAFVTVIGGSVVNGLITY